VSAPTDDAQLAASQEPIEVALAVLAPYNLGPTDSIHIVRGLRSLIHGFISLEAAAGFGLPVDLDESFERLIQTFLAGLRRATS
jgi:hypothetical protein